MSQVELTEICQFLSKTPQQIRLAVKNLTPKEGRFKPNEKEFSILEHVCHLRDIEELGYYVRIEKILAENNPFLPDIDGDRLAVEGEYQKKNLVEELERFADCRAKSLSMIKKIPAPDLEKEGELEGVGRIKLSQLLLRMFEHDEEHLEALFNLCSDINKPNFI